MNTYGHTDCPHCGQFNNMYRPLREMTPAWDEVKCCNCGMDYKHSEHQKGATDEKNTCKTSI